MSSFTTQNRDDDDIWLPHFDVTITCDDGCGREVSFPNVEPPTLSCSLAIHECRKRLAREGWEHNGYRGDRCRACLLRASGWQSQPGPAEPGRQMSVEAIGGDS